MRILHYIISFLFLVAACSDPPPSKYPTEQMHAEDATLGAGDTVEVRVYRQEEMSGPYEVSSEGNFSFPLIGLIVAEGKTPAAVQRDIQERLADGYLNNPSVTVLVKESKSKNISVVGEVSKPVTLPFADGMTLIDAIARAGGFTPMARKNAVTVTRNIEGKKTRYTIPAEDIGKGKANSFFIRPGDVVFVPRRVW